MRKKKSYFLNNQDEIRKYYLQRDYYQYLNINLNEPSKNIPRATTVLIEECLKSIWTKGL